MATKSANPTSAFAYGTDPESVEANDRWQQAYDSLLQAVEKRQEKPMFDPFWLKIAEAGAAPTRTGSFFETMGNTAGAIGRFQQEEQAKAEDLAQKRLELAGMGLQQANQRSALKEYQAASQAAPQGPSGPQAPAAPQAPSGPQGAPQQGSSSILSSMGYEDQGQQIGPPQPLPTERQFVAGKVATGGNPIEARMEYQKLLRDDLKVGPNGTVYQMSTGKLFAQEDPTPIKVPFLSLNGEEFAVTKKQANQLNAFTSSGNNQGRIDFENKLRGAQQPPAQPPAPPPAQPPAPPPAQPSLTPQTGAVPIPAVKPIATPPPAALPAAPTVVPPPAPPPPVGMQPESVRARLKAEEDSRRKIEEARQTKQAEADIAEAAKNKEENRKDERETIVDLKTKARAQANIADQVAKIATDYPNSMGTTAKPGVLAAGIKILEKGASIGGESAKASALEEAYQTLTGTQAEISARRVLMGLAAEYLFNLRALTKGQGTITDYETRVLESIGPSLGDDAKSARFKAHVMKMHAENEIDRVNIYQDWKKSPENKNLGWRDFLGSKENDRFAQDYNAKLDKAYDAFLGRKNPIGPPPERQTARPASNPSMDFARGLK
jgi:hypothetical protein